GAEPARGLPLVYALPADFNSDGIVDFDDFVIFAQYFGQRGGAAKPAAALTLPEILSNNPKLRQLAESHRLIGPALARYLATLPKFALLQNFPNPFNPETTIRYSLAEPALVDVSIYSASGQLVRTLVAEEKTVGAHAVMWDGTDSFGRRVASGLYLYRITAGSFTDVKRMLLLK
ncbi:MAG: T9SS type A sorting domain-containing protein, partial [Parcubacteria group bacterium]|nr:T9SS type A sorting domain-containing protein [Parcubacteria group bacterium]